MSGDAARAAVEEAIAEARETRLALEEALIVINVLADRLKPARVTDVSAELQVIGWACSGRAALEDFADLRPYDFSSSCRRRAYGMALAAVHLHAAGELPTCRAQRPTVALLTDVCALEWPEEAADFAEVCGFIPVPARKPWQALQLVASLGRSWSDVEEQWEMRDALGR